MIIRHSLPYDNYTKIDRHVVQNMKISDGAMRLYCYLCGLRNGANFVDKYIMKALNVSQAMLTRRKKELKDAQLILVDQVSMRIYVIYIGNSKRTAAEVKVSWVNEDADV